LRRATVLANIHGNRTQLPCIHRSGNTKQGPRPAMPAAWAQRDDLLQVEGKVGRPGSIAGTSRVVKIECRRQGWADGHYDRLPGWLPIWSATTSPLSQRRFRPRRRLRCRRGRFNFWKTTPYKVVFGCASCAPRQGEIGFAFQLYDSIRGPSAPSSRPEAIADSHSI
jgi:hypothetical protein